DWRVQSYLISHDLVVRVTPVPIPNTEVKPASTPTALRRRRPRVVFQDKGNGLVRIFTGWELKPSKKRKKMKNNLPSSQKQSKKK
ncbi:MAG TPA: hypothetical protein VES69_11625, partial [Pyrinomonadaceae bacterium]|nr:hypothetical protein [Pyrinomonadaceae bacterium]